MASSLWALVNLPDWIPNTNGLCNCPGACFPEPQLLWHFVTCKAITYRQPKLLSGYRLWLWKIHPRVSTDQTVEQDLDLPCMLHTAPAHSALNSEEECLRVSVCLWTQQETYSNVILCSGVLLTNSKLGVCSLQQGFQPSLNILYVCILTAESLVFLTAWAYSCCLFCV